MRLKEFNALVKLFKLDAWDITLSECKERPVWVTKDALGYVQYDNIARTAIIWAPVGEKQKTGIIHELLHLVFADAIVEDIPDVNEHRIIAVLEEILANHL